MAKKFVLVVALLACAGIEMLGQATPSIQGVWRRVELTVTSPTQTATGYTKGTHTNVQPGIFIFTAKHYSVQIDGASKPRPAIKVPAKPTLEEVQAAWGPYTSNAGTYEMSGTTLTMRHIVAMLPQNQGKGITRATIKLDGNNMWMTVVEVPTGKVEYPSTAKYVRVE